MTHDEWHHILAFWGTGLAFAAFALFYAWLLNRPD
jgi:hypothetical protein